MKLLLDSANLNDVAYFNENFPLAGVTTNPTILSREGGDIVKHLFKIRNIIGDDKELHIQVTETEYGRIIREAEKIAATFGENTFVKVPVSGEGLKVTMDLSSRGIKVTETAIFTSFQALLAANAGAYYVAPYVSRIENILADDVETIGEIKYVFEQSGSSAKILAASFKTAKQVLDAAMAGAHCATVSADILKLLSRHASTDNSVEGFSSDWKRVFGDNTLLDLLEKK